MPSTTSIAFVAALAGLAMAKPIAKPVEIRGQKSFTVDQVAVKSNYTYAPVVGMLKTYSKFAHAGAVAPSDIKTAAAIAVASNVTISLKTTSSSQSGSVAANPESYDESYLCPVVIGGQTLNLDFDTGSADLWVFSTLMPSTEQTGHTVYNPTDGTSTDESSLSWSITYGDGSGASGAVYADTVVVGSVTATSQAVEAATSASSAFVSDTDSDGLLGLAFSSVNQVRPTQQTTFFDTVKSSLALPLFTADLKHGEAGSYGFGYIDATKYYGSITYVDVTTSRGFWEFDLSGYAIGSGSVVSETMDTIADTGTTLMYLPSDLVTAYYDDVSGASYSSSEGGYIFPCSSTLPSLTLEIGGAYFTVPASYMNYAAFGNGYCFGGMQSNSGIGFSILGDVFLKSQFVIFSEVNGTPQIGFAAQYSDEDVYDEDDC